MQFDETGPNTHTRRYWVSATVAIGAMLTFVILSVLLVLGVVFGPRPSSPSPIRLSRGRCLWPLSRASRCSLRTSGPGRTKTRTRMHTPRARRVRGVVVRADLH